MTFEKADKYTPVSELSDHNIGVLKNESFSHLDSITSTSIVAEEVGELSCDCPVVFLRDEQSGKFQLSAIFGLTPNENLLVDKNGSWAGLYVPIGLEIAPFSFFLGEEETKRVKLDMSSPLISQSEGILLFENGKQSPFLTDMAKQLELVHDAMLQTEVFVESLVNRNIITECKMTLEVDGDVKVTEEFFTINTNEIRYMTEDDILDFHTKGYWSPMWAMKNSLNQFKRLVQLKQKRSNNKIKLSLHINQDEE